MGNILQGLGLGQQGPQVDPLAQYRPPVGGVPSVMQGGMDESGAMGNLDISVKGWAPHKPTILGAIADAYLMSKGGKPMFSLMRDQENVTNAMKGFTNDPKEAVRRIGSIPGHQKDAWDMYNQWADNTRADQVAQTTAEAKSEKFSTNLGGWLNSIKNSKDPNKSYTDNLPALRKYAEIHHLEDVDLPDAWNEDAINGTIMKNVSPEDQMKMEMTKAWRERRGDQLDRGLDQRGEAIQNTQDYRTTRVRQIDEAEQGRNDRHDNPPTKAGKSDANYVKTPRGWMELSPSGNMGRIGNQIWKKTAPGKWVQVDTVKE